MERLPLSDSEEADSGRWDPCHPYCHWLPILNIILLIVALYIETQQNQFFPHAKSRSAWWPWASCFAPVNPYEMCSQFLFDEYSVTHFSHGFVLWFWLIAMPLRFGLGWCLPQWSGNHPSSARFDWLGFHVSACVEILWELLENTPSAIQAFRQSGPNSADYAGDSGLNSLGDLIACQLGFTVIEQARMRLKCKGAFAVSAAYAVIMTIVLYFWICDGLILIWVNVIRPGTITCK